MRVWVSYVRQYKKGIGAFALCIMIFLAAFALYHIPVGAVMYPALVCIVLGGGYLVWNYQRFYRKHKLLEELLTRGAEMTESLPPADTRTEQDYQELLRALKEEIYRIQSENSSHMSDMTDYYTTWVHQIKTPIASMRLALQSEDSPLSRRLTEDLRRIEQYVEMVLVFLRLDSDSTDYVIRECNVDEIIRQAVHKVAGQFIYRGIKLNYEPLQIATVTDEKWLLFVVEQVLSNALKYSKADGSAYITIEMEEPKTLCIRDNGIGIAPEDLPRVFEKGYTGYNGRSDKKASGLGLYLCRRVCANLGHRITAESVLDEGTCVKIDLKQHEVIE